MKGCKELSLADAPPGFLARGEFAPRARVRAGEGAERVWLPLHPAFAQDARAFERPPAGSARLPVPDRAALFRAVADRWGLGLGPRAQANLARLGDPAARLVITGQQPGFLTGPLFTVYKGVTACAAARFLEERTGVPHLPVFWVAAEDHDLDEARSVRFPGAGGATAEVSLPHAADRRPLSAYAVDHEVEGAIEAALAHLEGRRHADAARALAGLYRGGDLAGGFARVMAALFESQGLLIIEPEPLRPAARAVIERCLREPGEVMARIREGIAQVEALGIPAQAGERFPLFLLEDGKRHHLAPEPAPAGTGVAEGRFRLEGVGKRLAASELLALLDREPERFSTGVLLRPVVQDALLPGAVSIGGPAEVAYFGQLGPLRAWFGLPPPRIALRLSATLIEGKVARALRRLGLEPGEAGAASRWARARGPVDLLPPAAGGPEEALRALAEEARGRLLGALDDPRLLRGDRGRLEAVARKLADGIRQLGERAGRAVKQAEGEDLAAARLVYGSFFPDGVLQERRWNVLYYLSKYGTGWIADLVEALAADPFRVAHRWVRFPEGEAKGDGE